jgi:hypothetical protein
MIRVNSDPLYRSPITLATASMVPAENALTLLVCYGGSVMRPADNNGGFDLDSRSVSASRRTLRFPLQVNGLSRDRGGRRG